MLKPPSLSTPHPPTPMPFEANTDQEQDGDPGSQASDHLLLDWIQGSLSFFSPLLDDQPYSPDHTSVNNTWDPQFQNQPPQLQHQQQNLDFNPTSSPPPPPPSLPQQLSPKKRKHPKRTDRLVEDTKKRKASLSAKDLIGRGSSSQAQDARWAEQLLNPCAVAIAAGNVSRALHLMYVLHELASLSGDANHRLAAHGLRALSNEVSATVFVPGVEIPAPPTFTSTEPRLFQNALIKFHEFSPWFSFPNSLANTSILKAIASTDNCRSLHIIDIGVSHGMQWPTLLESLTRRNGGPPPLVRLTIVAATGNPPSFSASPTGDDYPSRLLRFAKLVNINLEINMVQGQALQGITFESLRVDHGEMLAERETLVVCTQFRQQQLGHGEADEFMRRVREMEPEMVVLVESEGECGCGACGDYGTGFRTRVERVWRFMESTSIAYKGRECEERRVMEGEAGRGLGVCGDGEMSEGRKGWGRRMRRVGFVGEAFGDDALEGGRGLLKKYDGNWEMRVEEDYEDCNRCVCLCWKGQIVSFCSLWKLP